MFADRPHRIQHSDKDPDVGQGCAGRSKEESYSLLASTPRM